MRKTFTIGITNNGKAELLLDHNSTASEHKAALKTVVGEYKEVHILETGKGGQKKTNFSTGGGVDYKSALTLADQKKKGAKAPVDTAKGNSEGAINPRAALTLAEQRGGKKKAPKVTRRSHGKKAAAKKKASAPASDTSADAAAEGADEGIFAEGDSAPSL